MLARVTALQSQPQPQQVSMQGYVWCAFLQPIHPSHATQEAQEGRIAAAPRRIAPGNAGQPRLPSKTPDLRAGEQKMKEEKKGRRLGQWCTVVHSLLAVCALAACICEAIDNTDGNGSGESNQRPDFLPLQFPAARPMGRTSGLSGHGVASPRSFSWPKTGVSYYSDVQFEHTNNDCMRIDMNSHVCCCCKPSRSAGCACTK